MMQAYTEEQRNELIAFNKEKLAGLKFAVKQHALKSVRDELQKELATTEIALVALEAKPVGYGMQRKDNATFGSWLKPKHLVKENLIYRPAPLYLAQPVTATAIPSGWKLVPLEPTEDMIIRGFESAPNVIFSDPVALEEYQEMSGCQQAAHRAKLCYAAMLEAAPEVE